MIYVSNELKKPQRKKIKGIFCIKTNYRTDIHIKDTVRYIYVGNNMSPKSRMFHDKLNMSECTCIDHSGDCTGHEMSLKDFIVKYCGGIMPDSM